MNNANRKVFIDIAKGIAIILMVIGHSSLPTMINRWIFAFHMPLFFIVSGWTTNWEKYTLRSFIQRRLNSLILPFFVYSSIVLVVHVIYGWMSFDEFIYKGWGDGYALWFIPVLFLSSLMAKLLYDLKVKLGGAIFMLCLIMILFAGLDLRHYHILLPWCISTVPYATFLIVLGTEWGKKHNESRKTGRMILITIVAAVVVGIISHYWRLDLCFNSISPSLPLSIAAIIGTFMIINISELVENSSNYFIGLISKILQKVGQETYIIVAFSLLIIMLINYYVSINSIVKYIVLIGIIIILCFIKNIVVKLWKRIINEYL